MNDRYNDCCDSKLSVLSLNTYFSRVFYPYVNDNFALVIYELYRVLDSLARGVRYNFFEANCHFFLHDS